MKKISFAVYRANNSPMLLKRQLYFFLVFFVLFFYWHISEFHRVYSYMAPNEVVPGAISLLFIYTPPFFIIFSFFCFF